MSRGGFIEFREMLAHYESRGRYEVYKPKGPYFGKYQFGIARLMDLGLVGPDRKWIAPLNKEKFLASPELQDATFSAHVARHLAAIRHRYSDNFGKLFDGVVITPSGLVAAAHLVGLGSVNMMMTKGTRPKDGNGTTAVAYMCWMADYDLPPDLPLVIPTEIIC